MKSSNLKADALEQIQNSPLLKEYFSIAESDFEKLNGWTIIGIQLVEAKTSLELCEKIKEWKNLSQIEEIVLSNGIFKNFILNYSKCFSSSGKNRISLDANDIYSQKLDLKKIHTEILEIRNKYVAHNDDENGYDIALALTAENQKEIKLAQTYTLLIPYGSFNLFKETIEYSEKKIILKVNKIADKLEKKIGKKIIFS
ncbi:hypothetical protein [Chryseobacterium sp. Leaf394]|uniref:hypothetical protein n=1 Tax=Chryseobacterium sp. Leaf394 TaxID=1736361 RepID=UPI0006F5F06D|nr:hypothetical protein [Chryseobacterium sp. Leaf394]KQS93012.1 hypothetical protein ASG21_11445 [Chryseobacterium sp. Leaf394]